MELMLAPSYKAIALCILKNDMNLTGLGLNIKKSQWYDALKLIELKKDNRLKKHKKKGIHPNQLTLFGELNYESMENT